MISVSCFLERKVTDLFSVSQHSRVLLSIHQSPFSNNMIPQKNDLVNWANELLDALIPFFDDNSDLFHNYVDQKNTFSDGSGSMLIAGKFHSLASTNQSSRKPKA